jgi:hypothetical protein
MSGVDEHDLVDGARFAAGGLGGVSAMDRVVMRARLAVMGRPRCGDSGEVARLRSILRDEALMAHVRSNVEQWPPLSDEQCDVLGSLLQRSAIRSHRRRAA